MAQKREGKNRSNILEEGASTKIHAREMDTGISAPDICWNSYKVNGDMPSLGSLLRIRACLEKGKKKYRSSILIHPPTTNYAKRTKLVPVIFSFPTWCIKY